jgi:hypothetical protein
MIKWMFLVALLGLAGCATQSCEPPAALDKQTQRLLFNNDMLQAKLLITSGDLEHLPLADALLERNIAQDSRGEIAFYQAISRIRQAAPVDQILDALQRSASRQHPHAVALLYKMYNEPFLLARADRAKAAEYRAAYADLDVAKSGYPSFSRALMVVDRLVNPPPEFAKRR